MVGGGTPAATPGRTNEGCGLPGSGLGRGRIRDEDGIRSLPPGRNPPYGRPLDDGKRVPILAVGERSLERSSDRRDQPRIVRVLRVAGRAERT